VTPLVVPTVPALANTDLLHIWGGLPIRAQLSPVVLAVLLMLAGIFVAALSVMLVYHWRRFPYNQDVFRRAERVYFVGVVAFIAVALVGIFATL
jgi:hypothetical protein